MKREKKTLIFYLATGGFLLFGLLCIVLGFGFGDGWDKVLAWFTSRYAIYVYVFLFFYLIGIVIIWLVNRNNGNGN